MEVLFRITKFCANYIFSTCLRNSISSGSSFNHVPIGFDFCFSKSILRKGITLCLAILREIWHFAPTLAHMFSSLVLLPLVQYKVMILMGGEMNSNGL